jgi:cell division septal protein FtsQ
MSERRKEWKDTSMIERVAIWLIGAVAMGMAVAGVVGAVLYQPSARVSPVLKTDFSKVQQTQQSNTIAKKNYGEF